MGGGEFLILNKESKNSKGVSSENHTTDRCSAGQKAMGNFMIAKKRGGRDYFSKSRKSSIKTTTGKMQDREYSSSHVDAV